MNSLPISSKNKEQFISICDELNLENSNSIWTPLFLSEDMCKMNSTSVDDFTECFIEEIEAPLSPHKKNLVDPTVASPLLQEHHPTIEMFIDEDSLLTFQRALENIVEFHPQDIPCLDLFSRIPPTLICSLCQKIGDKALKDVAVAALLNALLVTEPPISISMAAAVVQCFVFPKVMDKNVNNFRSLCLAIVNFSDKYSSAIVEELFLPCIKNKELGCSQIEVLTKIISQISNEELICCSLKKVLETVEPNENVFCILKSLTERKTNATGLYSIFTEKLKEWSVLYNNSINFTKLIIAFISSYGNKISSDQLSMLGEIVTENRTVLKRAAESFLKNMQK